MKPVIGVLFIFFSSSVYADETNQGSSLLVGVSLKHTIFSYWYNGTVIARSFSDRYDPYPFLLFKTAPFNISGNGRDAWLIELGYSYFEANNDYDPDPFFEKDITPQIGRVNAGGESKDDNPNRNLSGQYLYMAPSLVHSFKGPLSSGKANKLSIGVGIAWLKAKGQMSEGGFSHSPVTRKDIDVDKAGIIANLGIDFGFVDKVFRVRVSQLEVYDGDYKYKVIEYEFSFNYLF